MMHPYVTAVQATLGSLCNSPLKGFEFYLAPNGKEHLLYVVNDFKIDAIMSNNWTLV